MDTCSLHNHVSGEKHPCLEIADIFRAYGDAYRQSHRLITPPQYKAMKAIEMCRTSALGGHIDTCDSCGYTDISYNSCRNRHCPKCQSLRQARWIAERCARILPIRYFHIVFTLPAQLRPFAKQNPETFYNILFDSASQTLITLGKDKKHLGALLGLTAVLHTWKRDLGYHPHLHCIVTGGGLSFSGDSWVSSRSSGIFPVRVLSALFRGKFLSFLDQAINNGIIPVDRLSSSSEDKPFSVLKDELYRKNWVVYAKKPFGGPSHVFQYLGRYTHRVAISNQRLIEMDSSGVTFSTKEGRRITLDHQEFIHRFLQHVLPMNFVKIRHYGIMASGNVKTKLEKARLILESQALNTGKPQPKAMPPDLFNNTIPLSWQSLFLALTGIDISACPRCKKGKMQAFPLPYLDPHSPPRPSLLDTS